MGGWPKMCRTELKELGLLQHRFMQSYRAYAERGQFDYPKRLGGDRSPDSEYEKAGLKLPRPALIGDPDRAKLVYQGGGAGFLKPETSTAFTGGIVFTPTFAPISIAFDYFNYEVRDQISELSASTIRFKYSGNMTLATLAATRQASAAITLHLNCHTKGSKDFMVFRSLRLDGAGPR